MNKHQV